MPKPKHDLNRGQIARLQGALFAYSRIVEPALSEHQRGLALERAQTAINACDGAVIDCLAYMGIMAAMVDFVVTSESEARGDK